MRLATLKDATRDGALIVVSPDGLGYAPATAIAKHLQQALDDWDRVEPKLRELERDLSSGRVPSLPLAVEKLAAPLPRAYEWVDGSAYLNHIVLVRRARGAEPPPDLKTNPLVYQGGSSRFLAANSPIKLPDSSWGLDFEAEVCVVLADVPEGVTAEAAGKYILLLTLANDITYRNLVPQELKKGFGFFNSKPATTLAPFAVTPDELGSHFRDGRVHLPLRSVLNQSLMGDPNAGPEMHFSFFDLIAHIAKTRSFASGTLLGSGTVSNADPARGVSCLAERRVREILEHGEARTEWLEPGDRIRIEMLDPNGENLFGTIDQTVVR